MPLLSKAIGYRTFLNKDYVLTALSRSLLLASEGKIDYNKPNFNILANKFVYSPITILNWNPHIYNENSKLISVEGSIGVGKTLVAKALAERLNLHFQRDIEENELWQNDAYGPDFNYRDLNSCLSKNAKFYSIEDFWKDKDPINNGRLLGLQFYITQHRYWNYGLALNHLFHTGQGVVTERSPHSDICFIEAYYKCGLMSKKAYEWYVETRRNTIPLLIKPHLVIFLKTSVAQMRKMIREKNLDFDNTAVNMTDQFLSAYSESLEHDFVARMKRYSEVLVLDMEDFDVRQSFDLDAMARQVSRLDLDEWSVSTTERKFQDWRTALADNSNKFISRVINTDSNYLFTQSFRNINLPPYPEAIRSQEAQEELEHVLSKHPRHRYEYSYDPGVVGLWGVLTNWKISAKKNFENRLQLHAKRPS